MIEVSKEVKVFKDSPKKPIIKFAFHAEVSGKSLLRSEPVRASDVLLDNYLCLDKYVSSVIVKANRAAGIILSISKIFQRNNIPLNLTVHFIVFFIP